MLSIIVLIVSLFRGDFVPPSLDGNCRPANGWSANELAYLQRIVTGPDAGNAKLRTAYKLPYVTTTPAVAFVDDDATCAAAAMALESVLTDSLPHRPVYLFRIGTTRFSISDGTLVTHIFDQDFHYLLTIRELD